MRNEIKSKIDEHDWIKGKIRELITLCSLCETKDEANYLISKYKKVCPEHWACNLGYIFGYCSQETGERLYKLFQVNHPILSM